MAKSPRQGDITYIRRCQDTGLSMPESMRIDVREIVPFAELVEPVCYTVWVHGITIILCEIEASGYRIWKNIQVKLYLYQ